MLSTPELKTALSDGLRAGGVDVIDAIEERFTSANVPVDFVKIHHEPDGNFPHGIPNPLLHDCRQATVDAVLEHKADMGIAWDGDFDRCFLFDEKGQFIEGYYIVDPRLRIFWITGQQKQKQNPVLLWIKRSGSLL